MINLIGKKDIGEKIDKIISSIARDKVQVVVADGKFSYIKGENK